MKEKEMEAKNRKVQAETKNLDANNQAEQKLMEMLNNGL
jgi:UDP:flavonoid glycosyltransferase YjiC (YdhE family)